MQIKSDQDIIKGYLEDSSNLSGGHAEGLYLPENEQDIIEAVKECNSNEIPLTASAGQTGTTGGCIPFGGNILSTQKLNKIIDIDIRNMCTLVEPGASLEMIEKAVAGQGLLYAPDPTEKKATIGGNVATNASGGRCFRFGSTRNHILGLRVVLPTGEVLDIERDKSPLSHTKIKRPQYNSPDTKSSAGYYSKPDMDLIDLFIGSEGTLGIVSQVKIKLISQLEETLDLIAFFPEENNAVDFVIAAKSKKDPWINFFEFFDENTLRMLKPSYPNIPDKAKAAIYIEQEIKGDQQLADWLKLLTKYNADPDACWIGSMPKQKHALSQFRHAIPEHINEIFKQHHSVKLATDIAVPDGEFSEMFSFYDSKLKTQDPRLFYIKFGHIGDNHLHVNIVPKNEEEKKTAQEIILQFVKKAVSLGGTVSAEHGIGKIKHAYLNIMYGDAGIEQMRQIKKQFDPNLILGKNNIFPAN